MRIKPVIYLVFADHEHAALPRLKAEQDRILDVFREPVRQGKVEIVDRGAAKPEQIFRDLETYKDRIVIVHFGGHANSNGLLFNGELSKAEGLAKAFSMQKRLKLVFLNGCSTYQQESLMRNARIPITIATSGRIEDELAAELAVTFYRSMSTRESVASSFQFAAAWLQQNGQWNKDNPAIRSYRHLAIDAGEGKGNGASNPWNLYHRDPKFTRFRLWKRYPFYKKMLALLFGLTPIIAIGIWISQPPQVWKVQYASPELSHLYGFISNWDSISLKHRNDLKLSLDLLPEKYSLPENGSFRFDSIPEKSGKRVRVFII